MDSFDAEWAAFDAEITETATAAEKELQEKPEANDESKETNQNGTNTTDKTGVKSSTDKKESTQTEPLKKRKHKVTAPTEEVVVAAPTLNRAYVQSVIGSIPSKHQQQSQTQKKIPQSQSAKSSTLVDYGVQHGIHMDVAHQFVNQQKAYGYDPNKVATSTDPTPEAKKRKIIREAAGSTWEDPTLEEWPENDYRVFVGDLGNEVTDAMLSQQFQEFASFQKAKVIRNKFSRKVKGYGFVSFLDPMDMIKALKEKNGKYCGNRPMKLTKSTWQDRNFKGKKKKGKKKF